MRERRTAPAAAGSVPCTSGPTTRPGSKLQARCAACPMCPTTRASTGASTSPGARRGRGLRTGHRRNELRHAAVGRARGDRRPGRRPRTRNINPTLYRINDANRFHDITVGNNSFDSISGYRAIDGWDPASGLGSPIADKVVPLLARAASNTAEPRLGAPQSRHLARRQLAAAAPGRSSDPPTKDWVPCPVSNPPEHGRGPLLRSPDLAEITIEAPDRST